MIEKQEKVIYNITLQSEDDDEVKVIDRCKTEPDKIFKDILRKLFIQFQYERNVEEKKNLLWAVVVLWQDSIGKC